MNKKLVMVIVTIVYAGSIIVPCLSALNPGLDPLDVTQEIEFIEWPYNKLWTYNNQTMDSNPVITKKTNFMYEVGIKVVKDRQVIENLVFIDIPIGIVLWTSYNRVSNCTFINNSDEGIVIVYGHHNIIENCVFYMCLDGIELQRSSNNTFRNCQFLSCPHAGIDGIMDNNNDNLFSFCLFYDSPYGCYFSQSNGNEFVNCTFIGNKKDLVERK